MNRLFLLLCVVLLTRCAAVSEPSLPLGIDHVVVIGVDGMSPNGIANAVTPTMDRMMAEGASTMHARAVLPTSSSSNWASMIMGADTEQHGITSNGWERDNHILPPVVTGSEELFPSIFGVLRQQKPDAMIASIYHWSGFGRLYEKSAVDIDRDTPTERLTARLASRVIRNEQPTLTFVHLDHVDAVGHGAGHGTSAYYASVSLADSLIGQIVAATEDAGIAARTLFIVSSDHGGVGYGHGGETLAEVEIPFILFGAGIKSGHTIGHTVYTYDNAATVAFALGLKQPYAWIGRPVTSAFVGFPEPTNALTLNAPVPAPVIFPEARGYEPAGGLFDEPQTVTMSSSAIGGTLRYTTDGSEPTAASPEFVEDFTVDTTTVVRARVFSEAGPSRIANAYFRIQPQQPGYGVRWTYYESAIEMEQLPDVDAMRPLRRGTSPELRLTGINPRENQFVVRYEATLLAREAGAYRFSLFTDDGSKLYINDRLVVDHDGTHGTTERSGSINLPAGRHALRVDYFQAGGGMWMEAYVDGPGVPKQIIPPDLLLLD